MLYYAVPSLANLLGPSFRANCLLLPGLGTGWSEGPRRIWVQGKEVRAPGAPGRDPEGCFANACTFLLVSGPPARASATDLAAAWVAGAPAHCFVRRSQKRT